MRTIVLAVVCSLLIGCQQKERTTVYLATAPPGTTNMKHIGNGWVTFEMEVGGRNRSFLFYQGAYRTVLVELQP